VPSIAIAIKDAGMTVNDIDEIVVVGDFTKTPMIINMIDLMFKGKNIRQHDTVSHYLASHGAALESSVV
jgi:molecular chaperone DnaK (HSP70)